MSDITTPVPSLLATSVHDGDAAELRYDVTATTIVLRRPGGATGGRCTTTTTSP
jgi:hypothetical protein